MVAERRQGVSLHKGGGGARGGDILWHGTHSKSASQTTAPNSPMQLRGPCANGVKRSGGFSPSLPATPAPPSSLAMLSSMEERGERNPVEIEGEAVAAAAVPEAQRGGGDAGGDADAFAGAARVPAAVAAAEGLLGPKVRTLQQPPRGHPPTPCSPACDLSGHRSP